MNLLPQKKKRKKKTARMEEVQRSGWDGVTQRLSVANRQTAKTSRTRKTPVITCGCSSFRTTQPKACAAFVAAATHGSVASAVIFFRWVGSRTMRHCRTDYIPQAVLQSDWTATIVAGYGSLMLTAPEYFFRARRVK